MSCNVAINFTGGSLKTFYAQVSTAEAGADKNGPLRKTASRQEVSKMIQNDNCGTSHRYAVDMQ